MKSGTIALKQFLILFIVVITGQHAFSQGAARAEYFIDSDPGFGQGTSITLQNIQTSDSASFSLDMQALSYGFHQLYIRVQDTAGNWGHSFSYSIFKEATLESEPNLQSYEYFVDADPGIGSAATFNTHDSTLCDTSFFINTAQLNVGFHKLFVRARDQRGYWSIASSRPFYKDLITTAEPAVKAFEYFIDSDPGYGNAHYVSFNSDTSNVEYLFSILTDTLSVGFHKLFVRAIDSSGAWGITSSIMFYKDMAITSLPGIAKCEYFIDNDPGISMAETFSFSGDTSNQEFTFVFNHDTLTEGFHNVFVRAMDNSGKWSSTQYRLIYENVNYSALPKIKSLEFFIGSDPGVRNAQSINLSSLSSDTSLSFYIDNNLLPQGFNSLSVRSFDENEKVGLTNSSTFFNDYKDSSLLELAGAEIFIDTMKYFGNADAVLLQTNVHSDSTDFSVSLAGLQPGFHNVFVRSKNAANIWGITCRMPVFYESHENTQLESVEFFVGDDQGFGSAANESVVVSGLIDSTEFSLDASALNIGIHSLNLRSKTQSGSWSHTSRANFCRSANASFVGDTVCFGNTSLLINNTTYSDTSTSYYWDLNNDGIYETNAADSVIIEFPAPGNNIVSLVAYNPGVCGDTIYSNVFVRFLPVPYIGPDTSICAHEQYNFISDTAWSSYLWNTGATTASITASAEGYFSLNATDRYGCEGVDSAFLNVKSLPTLNGQLKYHGGFVGSGHAVLNLFSFGNFTEEPILSAQNSVNGQFTIDSIIPGDYILQAEIVGGTGYQNVLTSYYDSTHIWTQAQMLSFTCEENKNVVFKMAEMVPILTGPYSLSGGIHYIDTTGAKAEGEPIPGAEIYVELEPDDVPILNVDSDTSGNYFASGLPAGIYGITVDIAGMPVLSKYNNLVLSGDSGSIARLDFLVDRRLGSRGIYIDNNSESKIILDKNIAVTVFPNPFSETLKVDISTEKEAYTDIRLFGIDGKQITSLFAGKCFPESKSLIFDMKNFGLNSGNYIITIQCGNKVLVKKIVYQK